MPLYPEKVEQHLVQFLWDSPNNGIRFINKIVWNAQGDPNRLFGKFIGQHGLGEDTTINQHIFGELTNFMSMYPEY